MKMTMSKALAVMVALCLALTCVPIAVVAVAAESGESPEVEWALVETPCLQTPDTERIFIGWAGTQDVGSLSLTVAFDGDGSQESWNGAEVSDGTWVFERAFTFSEAGTYTAVALSVTENGAARQISFSDLGMEMTFGVDDEADDYDELECIVGEDASNSSDSSCAATVVTMDPDDPDSTDEVVTALEEAEDTAGQTTIFGAIAQALELQEAEAAGSNVVVALDPGHDSTHTGASDAGLKEHKLTLKIANYCKAELETYSGVSVYMTRTTASCPYPSSTSSGNDIKRRVQAAVDAGASIYVSIHLNSADSTSAKGAEVIVPNSNYNSSVATKAKKLARAILDELEDAGVTLRSTSIYSKTASSDTYSDGSKADYFAVQRYAKLQGIPGIIVEHCFMSNASDRKTYLTTEAGLKKLGVADATGIASYLGLSKKATSTLATPSLTGATAAAAGTKVSWGSVSKASGYAVYRKKSGGSWKRIGLTTSTSYTDKTALTAGATYYYTVRAYKGTKSDALDHTYSGSYWSGYNGTGVKSVYLASPVLKGVAGTSSAGPKVSWSSVSKASGYAVLRKTSGGSWSLLGTTTSTSYTDTSTITKGTTYYYTVRAYRGSKSTATSNKYKAAYWSGYDSTGKSYLYLKTPSISSITAASGGVKVSWGKVSGAGGYAVYRKKSGGSWSLLGTTTSTSYTDTTGTAGTTYHYKVRAHRKTYTAAKSHKYSTAWWSTYNSGAKGCYTKAPTLKSTSITTSGIKVSWGKVSGATGYAVYRKKSGGSWSLHGTTTSTSYTDKTTSAGTTWYYTVRAYTGTLSTANSNKYSSAYWSYYDKSGITGSAYAIMGNSTVTVDQMVDYYNANASGSYPSKALGAGGASTIEKLAQIYSEECEDEGVRAEVAWCQAMLETGWLQFGGDVSVSQYNFAGIGATGGGASGASFDSVREGVRAQVQHLRAYADSTVTSSSLSHSCVDPRFSYVTKGSAKYVEILGSQENPEGYGWATSKGYGTNIRTMIKKLKTC